jgi:type IV secretory pathway VirB10-like protein
MPDGYAVDLDQAPGLNQIGETAFHDKVNNHYFKIFGASIAVGSHRRSRVHRRKQQRRNWPAYPQTQALTGKA